MTVPNIQNGNGAAARDPNATLHPPPPPGQPSPHYNRQGRRPSASARFRRSRRHSLPFVFPPPFQSNTSSTSLIASTAEGRPIPLDDTSAAHRTSALRELNRSQPVSRHRYTKSTGAPSTSSTTGTYSQPVIVRTYSGPPPSSANRASARRRVPVSSNGPAPSWNASNWRLGRNGVVINMARSVGKKGQHPHADAKLPPLESFSFKSIVADMQHDIGADLDRIAEICARSRYSLSNQYEVHVPPQGQGTGFLASGPSANGQGSGGPTLQAVVSDEERGSTRHKRRKGDMKRGSAAYSTLETIMGSSQSSDEDKGKKKPAAVIAEEVRGRAARKVSGGSAVTLGLVEAQMGNRPQQNEERNVPRRKSISFATAMMDSTRNQMHNDNFTSPRGSGTSLVGEPAKPETSRSHLEIRTSPEQHEGGEYTHEPPSQPSEAIISDSIASAAISNPEQPIPQSGLLSGLSSWIPWRGAAAVTETVLSSSSERKNGNRKSRERSYAEGTLRDLLRTADFLPDRKGKGIDQAA